MKDKNVRRTDVGMSFHLLSLFGKNIYYSTKDWQRVAVFKKLLIKLVNTYKTAIEINLDNLDVGHKKKMLGLIDQQEQKIKVSKDFDSLDQSMIAMQSELIFNLLGFMPNNDSKEQVTIHKSNWRLDFHRKVVYLQNNKQKVNLILELAKEKLYENHLNYNDLRKKYNSYFKMNSDLFIDWFKNKYSKIYLDIF